MDNLRQPCVPIVQQDLSHEETIVQIAYSLEALEKVISTLFTNVERAIETKKKRLRDIQVRCDVARQKVQSVASINHSIKVFSCYKYPAPTTQLFYKDPVFQPIEIHEPSVKIKCSFLPLDKLSLKEKLKFYHVRDSAQRARKLCETSPLEGLGATARRRCSRINATLLYNTNLNVYKQYKVVDPLDYVGRRRETLTNDKRTTLETDPISIGLVIESVNHSKSHYFYSPSAQDVPDIEAPQNLPHLTGIARDLNYADDDIRMNNTSSIQEKVSTETPENIEPAVELPTEVDDTVPLPSATQAAPLPPIPPPLPPPIDMENEVPPPVVANKKPIETTSAPPDARACLMAAIRQAGGKSKLRQVTTVKEEKKQVASKSLMDDLHEKLLMRRKGISGKVDNTDGILDRIVSMIPPPPTVSKQQTDDNDDWDD